jgi:hypothetical protein
MIFWLGVENTNRLITIPEALDLQALRVFCPAAKADISRHVILKVFFFCHV